MRTVSTRDAGENEKAVGDPGPVAEGERVGTAVLIQGPELQRPFCLKLVATTKLTTSETSSATTTTALE